MLNFLLHQQITVISYSSYSNQKQHHRAESLMKLGASGTKNLNEIKMLVDQKSQLHVEQTLPVI